jgi:small subunit ribosomal protein S16
MVKIRLMRMGMKGAPSYRVVVADVRSPRDGRIIENIGWYNPLTDPSTIKIDAERAEHANDTAEELSRLCRASGVQRDQLLAAAWARGSTAQSNAQHHDLVAMVSAHVSGPITDFSAIPHPDHPTKRPSSDNQPLSILQSASSDPSDRDVLPQQSPAV